MRHQLVLKYIDTLARAGSLRSAAHQLSITPSALNRRILNIEAELGVEIFERHASGMRPNVAGEILLHHIRDQIADLDRVKSRIADLSGMRAGHINVAATREVVQYLLPEQIKKYRAEFPAVTFAVALYERGAAEASLLDNSNDIAIVFEPIRLTDFQAACSVPQRIYCNMAEDHPLAGRESLKIYDCTDYPLLLPKRPEGIRHVLDVAAAKVGMTLEPAVESNSLDMLRLMSQDSDALSFSVAINLRPELAKDRLVAIPLDVLGAPSGFLFAGALRGRTLPVAAARFLEDITKELGQRFV